MPWSHEGYDSIHVVVSDSLVVEGRNLQLAFRALRQTSSLAEVHREANRIATAKGVYLTWGKNRTMEVDRSPSASSRRQRHTSDEASTTGGRDP